VDSHGRRRAQAEEHDLLSTYRIDVSTRSKHYRRYAQYEDDANVFDSGRSRRERKSTVCLLHGDSSPDNAVQQNLWH
jgi:hypothetical protein